MNIIENFININRYSRPGTKLRDVRGIVIHWTANPGSSALANRNYFNNLNDKQKTYASAHFIIDINGSIIQALPLDELAYHVGSKTYTDLTKNKFKSNGVIAPNYHTIGIELCHPDLTGKFTSDTLDALKQLLNKLLIYFKLGIGDVYTHQEIVGWKDCPRWFVNNPQEYKKFKDEFKLGDDNMWKKNLIQKALDLGLLKDKAWLDKADEPATVWFVVAMMINLYDKLKK